jgi:hypothetical protein
VQGPVDGTGGVTIGLKGLMTYKYGLKSQGGEGHIIGSSVGNLGRNNIRTNPSKRRSSLSKNRKIYIMRERNSIV